MSKLNHFNRFIPNSWLNAGGIMYVSQAQGASDNNPGTLEQPFRTITRAAQDIKTGCVIEIGEGVYREEIPIPINGHQYNPGQFVCFRAMHGHEVYIRGSESFDPEWIIIDEKILKAPLPDSLFLPDTYNPYALSNCINNKQTVRPCAQVEPYPETLGQIYIDNTPLRQVTTKEALSNTPETFLIPADGKHIMINPGKDITGSLIELTMRQKCFTPAFSGIIYMNVSGIRVEHAAEPGAFCIGRFGSIRENTASEITIRKDFSLPGASDRFTQTIESLDFTPDSKSLIAGIIDDTFPNNQTRNYSVLSNDCGLSWESNETDTDSDTAYSYFTDTENNMMMRYHWSRNTSTNCYDIICEYSDDSGKSWNNPARIDQSANYGWFYEPLKLNDGSLLWQSQENQWQTGLHLAVKTWRGIWIPEQKTVNWNLCSLLKCKPEESGCGLSEPHTCQLDDGRLIMLLRQGAVLPSQKHPGVPSVKLICVSEDCGKTWSKPRPLTYEDGSYVYSPRSYQDILRSPANGRVYALLNICNEPTNGCDPRNVVHIGEIDPNSLCLIRDTVTIIEQIHPEHHQLVRFSNWRRAINPATGNILLFMKLQLSEFCQVRHGYDQNTYRYEIIVPKD